MKLGNFLGGLLLVAVIVVGCIAFIPKDTQDKIQNGANNVIENVSGGYKDKYDKLLEDYNNLSSNYDELVVNSNKVIEENSALVETNNSISSRVDELEDSYAVLDNKYKDSLSTIDNLNSSINDYSIALDNACNDRFSLLHEIAYLNWQLNDEMLVFENKTEEDIILADDMLGNMVNGFVVDGNQLMPDHAGLYVSANSTIRFCYHDLEGTHTYRMVIGFNDVDFFDVTTEFVDGEGCCVEHDFSVDYDVYKISVCAYLVE